MKDSFGFAPDPENPGWHLRPASHTDRFVDIFGDMRVRVEAPDRARMRVTPEGGHRNIIETAHGGYLLAVVDQSLFVAPTALGIVGAMRGVTVDTAMQFLAPVSIGQPIDIIVEVLRETGRMIFMRGIIEQDGVKALAFSGTTRKATPPKAAG